MRRLAALALTLGLLANAALAGWALMQHPFARPFVLRSEAAVDRAIRTEMARRATPEALATGAAAALAAGDLDRMEIYADLSNDHGIALPPELLARMQAEVEARSGFWTGVAACGACAWDAGSCDTLARLGACALTVELTPLGDLNALRRAGVAMATGDEVDRVDAGLAVVGLAATGAALLSGGTSYTVKAGASALRLARRIGALTPALARRVADLAGGVMDWRRVDDVALGRIGLDEALDAARLAELGRLAHAAATLREKTSLAEAVVLLRHADSIDEAEDLARIATAAGPRTRHALDLLGKPAAFRLLHRLSDLAALAIGAVALLAAQIGHLLLALALRLVRALLRGGGRRRARGIAGARLLGQYRRTGGA